MPHAEMGFVLIVERYRFKNVAATTKLPSSLNSTKKIERRTREISSRGGGDRETADECVWREVERSLSILKNSGEDESRATNPPFFSFS